jgi:hypothetical protein
LLVFFPAFSTVELLPLAATVEALAAGATACRRSPLRRHTVTSISPTGCCFAFVVRFVVFVFATLESPLLSKEVARLTRKRDRLAL